jgi:hypothetical protein
LVYVLAAYSITVCVLLVYGLVLQHRTRIARLRLLGETKALESGFNFGAALLAPFWALAHGLQAGGLALLASVGALVLAQAAGLRIAALGLAALLVGASVFLGVVGNRIAAARMDPGDPERGSARQLAWSIAGALIHTVLLPWALHFGFAAA